MKRVSQLRDRHPELERRGVVLAVVVCQDPETVRAHFERQPAPFPIVLDAERKAARAFGVYRRIGLDAINIARSSTFVIDGEGLVRRRFLSTFQWQRMPIDDLLRSADELRAGAFSRGRASLP